MNNYQLRALIVRLQDRLTEDDRKRLHFFLGNDVPRRVRDDPSLGGTLSLMESLFDQDKINEDDFTFLINAFDEIQCADAVKFLREHMRQIQSNGINDSVQSLSVLMPPLFDQIYKDQENDKLGIQMPLINKETNSKNNHIIINSNNSNINSRVDTVDNETKLTSSKQLLIAKREKYWILSIVLSILLFGVIISGCIWIIHLNNKYNHIVNDQEKNNKKIYSAIREFLLKDNDTLYHLKNLLLDSDEKLKKLDETLLNYNQSMIKLDNRVIYLEDDLKFTEGKTCGCAQWCREHDSPDGVCGDGHVCHCTRYAIPKGTILKVDGCRCDDWCKRHNYKNGGICGDGYTCICTP